MSHRNASDGNNTSMPTRVGFDSSSPDALPASARRNVNDWRTLEAGFTTWMRRPYLRDHVGGS